MNITTLGNTSLLFPCDNILHDDETLIPNLLSPVLRLPINIYILQLIISRHWIMSEFYVLKEAIFEIFICLYDILGIATYCFPNTDLMRTRYFFVGFIVTGRPCLLALICVERYLAVVKPVVFLKLKPVKYKLAFSGIVWLLTLMSCLCNLLDSVIFYYALLVQIPVFGAVKIYCCIATLLVLKQPGPGEVVKQREGMGSIKLRAFRVILIITLSVILTYVPLMLVIVLKPYIAMHLFLAVINVCFTSTTFSGLVQALLFLRKSGKLTFIKWL